jgi:signal transduction histidine kinase
MDAQQEILVGEILGTRQDGKYCPWPRQTEEEQPGSIPEITSIVHDLRNPLSTIHGIAEILIDSSLSKPQVQRVARHLFGASVRIKDLIDEFLNRYKGAEKGTAAAGIRELVSSAVDKVALLAESQSVQIIQDVPQGLTVTLDWKRMERVLVNLLVNALDVMPDGGTIRISAVPQRHSVLIKVRDTGPGIAPEIRDRLFQPFATAGKNDGMGIGLAASRQAVIDHGGQIWAETAQHGACFAFCLPTTKIALREICKPSLLSEQCPLPYARPK